MSRKRKHQGPDGLVDVQFTEDNVRYTTELTNVQDLGCLQVGDIRPVKWSDGKYYSAQIKSIGNVIIEEPRCVSSPISHVNNKRKHPGKTEDTKKDASKVCEIGAEPYQDNFRTNIVLKEYFPRTTQDSDTQTEHHEYTDSSCKVSLKMQDSETQTYHCEYTDASCQTTFHIKEQDTQTEEISEKQLQNTDVPSNIVELAVDETWYSPFLTQEQSTPHQYTLEETDHFENTENDEAIFLDLDALNIGLPEQTPKLIMPNEHRNESFTTTLSDDLNGRLDGESSSNEIGSKGVKIQVVEKGKSKQFCCPFCEKLTTALPRHLRLQHKEEPDVIPLFSEDPAIRGNAIEHLRLRGTYKHNTKVEVTGHGMIIAKRRPISAAQAENYTPCDLCTAYVKVNRLARHQKNKCPGKNLLPPGRNRNAVMRSKMMRGVENESGNMIVLRDMVKEMGDNEISQEILNDSLIKEYGIHLINLKGFKKKFIKDKIRELSRLLLAAKKLDENVKCLTDLMSPTKYNVVVQATKHVAGYNEQERCFKAPTLAIKIGQSLKKCIGIQKKMFLTDDDMASSVDRLDRLVTLFNIAWAEDIVGHARRNLDEIKWNKPERVPSSTDVAKLNSHLKELSIKFTQELRENPSNRTFRDLCEVALCRTILYNRKRIGEVQSMLKSLYERSLKERELAASTIESINEVDRAFAKSLLRMKTRGKRDRGVSVMFTTEMQTIMHELFVHRDECGIPSDNPYLFPCAETSDGLFRAGTVLQKYVLDSGVPLTEAWRLTSTGLRKHVATVSQLMNLANNELDCLAKYLGHSITVHRQYYRLTEESVELGKISKLLSLMAEGRLSELKNKPLDELTVNEDLNEEEVETVGDQHNQHQDNRDAREDEKESDYEEDGLEYEDNDYLPKRVNKTCDKSRKKLVKKRPWSDLETSTVQTYFIQHIIGGKGPNKKECESFLSNHGHIFNNRTYRDIVYHVSNLRRKRVK